MIVTGFSLLVSLVRVFCNKVGPVSFTASQQRVKLVNAVQNQNMNQIKNLIEHGVDVNSISERDGWTALIWAARNGHG